MADCYPKGDVVPHAMLGITRLRNLALAGWPTGPLPIRQGPGVRPLGAGSRNDVRSPDPVKQEDGHGGAEDERAGSGLRGAEGTG